MSIMALTQKDLERLWPEGPAAAYRATAERLANADEPTMCPATGPDPQICTELRGAVQGLMTVEAERLEVARRAKGLSARSWLMTSRALNKVSRVVLEGAR